MRTIQTDENNDLILGIGHSLVWLDEADAIAQETRHAAAALRGEMVLAADRGVPFFEVAFGASPNIAQLEAALRAAIRTVEGVTGIERLQARQDGDTVNYEAEITTIYGMVSTNGRI